MAAKKIHHKIAKTYTSTGAVIVVFLILLGAIFYSTSISQNQSVNKPLDIKLKSANAGSIVKAQAGDCTVSDSQVGIDSVEQQMANDVNQYRQQNGLPSLPLSYGLSKTAAWMANDMATHGYVSHVDSLGRNYDVRLQDCGYSAFGADIVGGDPSADPATILTRFEGSPDHNRVILSQVADVNGGAPHQENWTAMGVGRVFRSADSNWYWTITFGLNNDGGVGSGGGGNSGGGGGSNGVCGTLCTGTCPHGGIVKDGPGGSDIDPDFQGQCGQAYYGTDGQWYACTSNQSYPNGWVPIAAGSCLNGSIIDADSGACLTNEFIGEPGRQVCGSTHKEYKCQAGLWAETGNSCGPGGGSGGQTCPDTFDSNGTAVTGATNGTTICGNAADSNNATKYYYTCNNGSWGSPLGVCGGGSSGGGGGGGSNPTPTPIKNIQYQMSVTLDKQSYKPGDTMRLCYKISQPSVSYHSVINYSQNGNGNFVKFQEFDETAPNGGRCVDIDLLSDATLGPRQFQVQAFVDNKVVAEGQVTTTVGSQTGAANSPTPAQTNTTPTPTGANPTVTFAPTATNTPAPSNTPTLTPTKTPTPTTGPGTPTPTQTNPTATQIPVATTLTPTTTNGTSIFVVVQLPGVGGNTNVGENPDPVRTSLPVQLDIYSQQGNKITNASGSLTYQKDQPVNISESLVRAQEAVVNAFAGNINVANIQNGTYIVKVRSNNSLWKASNPHIVAIGSPDSGLGDLILVTGDLNQDNTLNLLDYNILISCYGSKTCNNKDISDLNLDGKVDEKDLNIFYTDLAKRNGD